MSVMPEHATANGNATALPSGDRVTSSAWKALAGSALGYAMDGFDLLILGFMLRLISTDLHLTPAQAASLVTATLIGAVIGGVGFDMLSDRLGRVRVLTWTIVLFAVFTGLSALSRDIGTCCSTAPFRASALEGSSASAWPSWQRPGPRPSEAAPRRTLVWAGNRACWRRRC